jgi:putative oxidoreductase
MSWKRVLTLAAIPQSLDAGLFVLRLGFGLSLFLKHGLEKLTGYSHMVTHFPDPIGIGPHLGLAYALLSDGICSLLVILGLGTRWAAGVIVFNLIVVFTFVHHMNFLGDPHVEPVVLYIVGFLAILIAGAGRWSLDHQIGGEPK